MDLHICIHPSQAPIARLLPTAPEESLLTRTLGQLGAAETIQVSCSICPSLRNLPTTTTALSQWGCLQGVVRTQLQVTCTTYGSCGGAEVSPPALGHSSAWICCSSPTQRTHLGWDPLGAPCLSPPGQQRNKPSFFKSPSATQAPT